MTLEQLAEGTKFTVSYSPNPQHLQGREFQKGGGSCKGFGETGETQCKPFMGGVYQSHKDLLEWIPNNTTVFCV